VPVASDNRKILLVTNDLGPRAGGIETFILGLLEKLDGSQIAIFTSSQEGDQAFDQKMEGKFGVKIYRDRAKVLLPTPRVVGEVKRVMRIHNSQIIWFGAAAPLALMAANLRKAGAGRIVSLTHGHEVWWSKLPVFRQAMRHVGNSVDVLTYLGEYTKEAMEKAVGKNPKLIHIAPGISVNYFKPGEKPEDLLAKFGISDRPTLISVGRLVHRKGQDKLIEAMPIIKREIPNALLLIVGSGPREAHLKSLIKKYSLENDVLLFGRVPYEELPKYFLLGDVFAMPARSRLFGLEVEGLGIVYLEASACGLPVIAGRSGGAPDAVKISETGLVVNGTDINEIANASIALLGDRGRAKEYGANGRAWVVEKWNWDNWGEKFRKVLDGVLES
jgi:phosphatidyl-myo-inositol dimannoside synthase